MESAVDASGAESVTAWAATGDRRAARRGLSPPRHADGDEGGDARGHRERPAEAAGLDEHAAEHRDPEGAGRFDEGLVHAGGRPGPFGGCRRHDQLGAGGGRGADADAEEEPGDRHHRQAPDAPPRRREHGSERSGAEARRGDPTVPERADEPGIADGGDQRRHRRGDEEETGHHRGLAERALDPLRDHELRAEHGEEQRRHGGGAPQEARVVSGGGVDQRTVRTRFVPGERDEQEHTDQRRAHHQAARASRVAGLR